MSKCPRCEARGKTWSGSDPKCAFPEGVFVADNWNCATMSLLRAYSGEADAEEARKLRDYQRWHVRDDLDAASFGVLHIPDNDVISGYLCMSWYKSRCKTGRAIIMCDDDEPHTLTLVEAEAILAELDGAK